MTETSAGVSRDAGTQTFDLLNELVGIQPGSRLDDVRAHRAEAMRTIQGSYDTLLEPDDEAGVSRLERGLIALRVAVLNKSVPLREHYRAYLAQAGAPPAQVEAVEQQTPGEPLSPRTLAILAHVDRLTHAPHLATPAHIQELQVHDLGAADIVTIAQLISFLSFQVRAVAGLQLLKDAS